MDSVGGCVIIVSHPHFVICCKTYNKASTFPSGGPGDLLQGLEALAVEADGEGVPHAHGLSILAAISYKQ